MTKPRDGKKRSREIDGDVKIEGVMTRAKRRKLLQIQEDTPKILINHEKKTTFSLVIKRLTKEDLAEYGVQKNKNTVNTTTTNETKPGSSSSQNSTNGNKVDDTVTIKTSTVIAVQQFKINDIVWAKIKGSPHWPAKVKGISQTAAGKLMYEIRWYNDYRRTKIHRLQLCTFLENFRTFSSKLDQTVGLRAAAFEAMYDYRSQMTK